MFWQALLVVSVGVASALGGHSPHPEVLEDLMKMSNMRISNNVLEDATLDVPGLIMKYGYPMEVHSVTTEDGYVLQMHRISHGRDAFNSPGDRPVVFLMHGLLSSSADWVLKGPECALAYILAEEGFDVWMGNARGNFYSRQHIRLNPDARRTTFWQFSWDDIGNYDLPTMIDYVLANTGRDRLHYIGHSQGTTAFFVMASLRPAYNNKIISMHAFAPVAYMANNRNLLLRFIAQYSNNIEFVLSLMGIGEFLPNNDMMTWAGHNLCMDEATFQPMCSNILFLVGGWNENQHNATLFPLKLAHTPAGASSRQFVHYGQGINGREFRRYDYGNAIANMRRYGRTRPPRYDLSKITTPVFLHYSDSDPLAHVNDVDRLFRELGRPIGKFRVPMATFSHLDFVWGIDAKDLVFRRAINLIKSMDINAASDE